MTTRSSSTRGFTLIELMVSLGVGAIVLAVVMGIVIIQQRAQESAEVMRTAIASGRGAIIEFERTLRQAGYGIDPRFAFDFTHHRCATGDKIDGLCRDRQSDADSLTFVARDARYRFNPFDATTCLHEIGCPVGRAWRFSSFDGGAAKLTIEARKDQVFRQGQILLGICRGSASYTMATVAETVTASATGNLEIPLLSAEAGNPYRENNLGLGCYAANAHIFAVNRFHYRIHDYDGVPWLVLETGLDLNDDEEIDEDDFIPIAPNVEDLQVAYVLQRFPSQTPPDSDENGIIGDDASTPEEPDSTATAPLYATGKNSTARRSTHPANVRSVRVSVVVRSERPDPNGVPGWMGDAMPQNENSTRVLGDLGRFRRQTFSTTVNVRNLASDSMYSL